MKNKILMGGALALLSMGANAATYCVSPNGDDGLETSSCYKTINAAVGAAVLDGDVVLLKSGTYPYEGGVTGFTAGITLKGSSGAKIDAGLNADGTEAGGDPAIIVDSSDVTIIGLKIFNGWVGIGIESGVDRTVIQKSTFTGIMDTAIVQLPGSTSTKILKNKFLTSNHGIYIVDAIGTEIRSNQFKGMTGDSIYVESGDGTQVVSNKVIDGNGISIELDTSNNVLVEKNKVNGTIAVWGSAGGVIITRNKLKGSGAEILAEDNLETVTVSLNKVDMGGGIFVQSEITRVVKNSVTNGGGIEVICSGDCATADDGTGAIVEKNSIRNSNTGLLVANYAPGTDMTVVNNRVDHVTDVGLNIAGDENVIATSNKIRFAETCIETQGAGTHTILSNKASTCTGDGINIQSPSVTVNGNKIAKVAGNGVNLETGGSNDNAFITKNSFKTIAKYVVRIGLDVDATDLDVNDTNTASNFLRKAVCDAGTGSLALPGVDDVYVPTEFTDCPNI